MNEKAMRSMSKSELINIINERDDHIASLEKTMRDLHESGKNKKLSFESFDNAGSIAEASLQVSNIFTAAQESADKYLESIRDMEEHSKKEAARIIESAREEAGEIIRVSEAECAENKVREKEYIDSLWADLQEKLLQFYEKYSELSNLFAKINFVPPPKH